MAQGTSDAPHWTESIFDPIVCVAISAPMIFQQIQRKPILKLNQLMIFLPGKVDLNQIFHPFSINQCLIWIRDWVSCSKLSYTSCQCSSCSAVGNGQRTMGKWTSRWRPQKWAFHLNFHSIMPKMPQFALLIRHFASIFNSEWPPKFPLCSVVCSAAVGCIYIFVVQHRLTDGHLCSLNWSCAAWPRTILWTPPNSRDDVNWTTALMLLLEIKLFNCQLLCN